jgi:hypothetical protein
MSSLIYRYRKSAFKCILAVIGLVLFTVQVSYKFFVFSSQPMTRSKSRSAVHSFQICVNPAIPNVHNNHHLLLDKRYEIKHTFAFPALIFELHHFPRDYKQSFYDPPDGTVSCTLLYARLRGPPSI